MKYSKLLLSILWIPLALASCLTNEESEYEKYQNKINDQISTHIATNKIEAVKSNYGFYYQKLITNTAGKTPVPGEVMLVKYKMQKLNGDIVEDKTDEISKFKYDLNSVIPYGAVYGIKEMKTGEKIRVYLPAYLAYEAYGTDKFGPDTNFILEMELVDTKTESQINTIEVDSITSYIAKAGIEDIASYAPGLYYKALENGDGDKPLDYNDVKFHYTRMYLDSTVIQKTETSKPLVASMSNGSLVPGLRQGLLKMKKGETALLIMPSEIGFGSSLMVMPSTVINELFDEKAITTKVKPYTPIMYEVKLLEVN